MSPIKKLPLRNAGQFTDEKREEMLDEIIPIFTLVFSLVAIVLIEWIQFLTGNKVSPWYLTGLAIIILIYAFFNIRPKLNILRDYYIGGEGEKYVAGYFNSHIYEGYIFNDIQTGYDNVDIVILSPRGVFAIEIKTLRKQRGIQNKISSPKITNNAVVQALRESSWLRKLIGSDVLVTPVVLYPEWWIEESVTTEHKQDGVLVFNEKYFLSHFENLPKIYSRAEIDKIRDLLLEHHNKSII